MAATITMPASAAAPVARYTGKREHGELAAALRDPHPGVRAKALYDMAKMGERGAEHMDNHEKAFYMLDDPSVQVRVAAIIALGCMGRYGAYYVDYLASRLDGGGSEIEVKRAAARALGNLGELAAAHADVLERRLDEERDPELVAAVCVALGAVRAVAATGRLLEQLRAEHSEVVVAACRGLGALAQGGAELVELLDHQEARIRAAAAAAIAKAPSAAAEHLDRLAESLTDVEAQVRISAVGVISALGPLAAPQVPRLGKLLEHEDPGVRAAAAAALGGIGEAAAPEIPRLERLLAERDEDKSTHVLTVAGLQSRVPPSYRKPACAAAASLAVLGAAAHRSAGKLAESLDSFDEEIRVQCACALAGMGKDGARCEDQVLALLDDTQPMVVAAACYSLGSMAEATQSPGETIAARVAERVKDKHPAVRGAAVGGLGKMGDDAAAHIEDIARCLNDRVGYVRMQAIEAVVGCGEVGQMFAGEVCRLTFDGETRVRVAALGALPRFGERGAAFAEEVASLMDDQSSEVRAACVRALGNFRGIDAAYYLPAIAQLAESDESDAVRSAARDAASALQALEDGSARDTEDVE